MPKILLVEDDNNLREIFQMRLIAEGYDTVTAGNGEEGLVVAMKEKPDLIISDVMMPKLSGFEMMETLRAAPEMADTKAIMMTALGQAEDRARGEKLGVLKYLVKSQVTLEDFVRVVREVIQPDQTATGTTAVAAAAPANSDQIQNNQESETHMPPADPATNPVPADSGAGSNPISGGVPADTSQPTTEQEQNAVQDQINSFVSGSDAAAAVPAEPTAAPADGTSTGDASAVPAAPADSGSVFGGEPTAEPAAPAAPAPTDTTAPEVPASTEPAQDAPTPPASSEGTGGAL
jgi:CheY-like chemotaxis protein